MENYSIEEKISILSKVPAFEGLNRKELRAIARICTHDSFEAGTVIFRDCAPGMDMYIMLKGKVAIKLESITPNYEIGLTTVNPREVFGEFSLIDCEPRSATATVIEPTEVLTVDGKKMHALFEKHPRMGYLVMRNLARTISSKIRRTNRKLLNVIRVKLYE
ncbi:cyclic nucleotide-binding domain-containing protein [Candidatus Sumerlaeota bacterium]|nr:cyclic nucleotide-binding domain-containing protein [Candidatus Sumerlaeota bacterium]